MKVKKYIVGILLWLLPIANGYGADWCVQVSTFRNIEGIKQDFRKVKTKNDARIEKIEGIYSLRVGYFDTEAQAKGELKSIKGEFPKAIVRKCANEPDRVIESSLSVRQKQDVKPSARPSDKPADKPAGKPVGKSAEKQVKASRQPSPVSSPAATSSKALVPSAAVKAPASSQPVPAALKPSTPKAVPIAPPVATPPKAVASPAVPSPPLIPTPAPPVESAEPQKLYDDAERHRVNGNYTLAIDLYKKVIQLSVPDGVLAGRASYRAALCYDVIGEKKTSEAGYAQAIERWPGLDIAPMEILFAGGVKAYRDRQYDGALKIFSLHLAAYPADIRRTEYMMACTLMQQGRYNAAMFLFSRIIEKYPDSSEAIESIVAFGNIGLMVPKVRATMFMKGHEWYRDPIHAYDTALKMKPDKVTAERILYIKGCALMVLGRCEEAQRVLTKCLRTYALSLNVKTYRAAAGFNLPPLFKIYYEREDYAGVVGVYFQSAGNDVLLPIDAATVIIIGMSLHRMGLNEDASNFLKAARIKANGKDADEIGRAIEELGKSSDSMNKVCGDILKEYRELQSAGKPVPPTLAIHMADCLFMARQYGDCIPVYRWVLGNPLTLDERRWALLRTGQANLKLGKTDIAKKTFDELKATGADEFWSKLADFAYDDGKWTEKYNQVTKKK